MTIREGRIEPIQADKIRLTSELRNLPDKLSDLIELSLKSLEECESDDNYKISFADWHKPIKSIDADKVICYVDLAGAVLAKVIEIPHKFLWTPECAADSYDKYSLIALNYVRLNAVSEALQLIHLKTSIKATRKEQEKIVSDWVEIPDYADGPEQFKAALTANVKLLRTYNL